ncbi:MAG: glycosyltransferase family 2 protein [Actinobacteria bacterium]|nr:glycosyltransferase family 2 protein [Actinomycetota bacterium]
MSLYNVLAYLAIAYYLLLYSLHLQLLLMGYRAARRWRFTGYIEEAHRLSRSALVPPVSIAVDIDATGDDPVRWVDHVLAHRFPRLEVLVLCRDLEDSRADLLVRTYYLRRVDRVYRKALDAPSPERVYQSDDRRLTLATAGGARTGELLNLALNLARYPLFGVADRSSYLAEDALLRMVRPFMEAEACAPAVMGVEIPLEMEGDHLLPPRRITRFSLMESLRWQLGYLAGSPYLGGPAVASGAFVLYRKEDLVSAGGFLPDSRVPEAEMDMTLRLHRLMRESGRHYRFAFLPQLVARRCFPRTWGEHVREVAEMRRGMKRSFASHADMLLRRGYGWLGMVHLPAFWLFVNLAPALGLAAFSLSLLFFVLGLVGWPVFAAFLAAFALYPALVGVLAVAAARRELDILGGQGALLYGYAFLTQVWFRQFSALARYGSRG